MPGGGTPCLNSSCWLREVHFLRSNRPEDMKRLDELCGSPEQVRLLPEVRAIFERFR